MFRSSFIDFLEKEGISYTSLGGSFAFPEHHLEIILVPADCLSNDCAGRPDPTLPDRLFLYEDRWISGGEVLRKRILARLGRFRSIFARKCNVVSGSSIAPQVADFMESYHSYGNARCKHRYALLYEGEIVAAATFSKPRPMPREDGRTYLSFEWVRYASVPGTRVVGGMGRVLKAFLKDAAVMGQEAGMPIEVMSYSDNEWSVGDAYIRLGFRAIGERAPVRYLVDANTGQRYSVRKFSLLPAAEGQFYEIHNQGSRKFLLTYDDNVVLGAVQGEGDGVTVRESV